MKRRFAVIAALDEGASPPPAARLSGVLAAGDCHVAEIGSKGAPRIAVAAAKSVTPALSFATAPDGSIAIVDGEVYAGLDGASPAAALLARYRAHGIECLKGIEAAAGFVIADAQTGAVHLARDRAGLTPIYHARIGKCFAAAADIETLIAMGAPVEPDLLTADFFLGKGYAVAPWSFLRAARKVRPGHVFTHRAGVAARELRYAFLNLRPKIGASVEEAANGLDERLRTAVGRRLEHTGRLGMLLSGGVDSALIMALVARRVSQPMLAVTFRYSDYEGPFNEEGRASAVVRHTGGEHCLLDCTPRHISDHLSELVALYGEPFSYGLHSAALSAVAGKDAGVFFTGVGADVSNISRFSQIALMMSQLPRPMRGALGRSAKLATKLPGLADPRLRALHWAAEHGLPARYSLDVLSIDERTQLYGGGARAHEGDRAAVALLQEAHGEFGEADEVDRLRLLHERTFAAECLFAWNTAWSRAYGLSIRHPYTDESVKEYLMQLAGVSVKKPVIRELAARYLPPSASGAPKVFQTIPVGHWFRGPLRDFVRDRLSPARLARRGIFDGAAVTRLIEEHESGKRDRTWGIWGLLTLDAWMENAAAIKPIAFDGMDRAAAGETVPS